MEDLNGLGWAHMYKPAISTLQVCSALDESHYPEMLKRMFIINTPRIFTLFFSLVKPMMDKRTLDKIRVLGTDFLPVLEKHVDSVHIPKEYGGKCERHSNPCLPSGGKLGSKTQRSVYSFLFWGTVLQLFFFFW